MLRTAVFAACFCALALSCAEARPRANLSGNLAGCSQPDMRPCGQVEHHPKTLKSRYNRDKSDGLSTTHRRPRAWCGWWLSRHLGIHDRRLWRALAWRHVGRAARGPAIGVVAIWSRGGGKGHVGIITGKTDRGWVVLSGNDGNAVRERVRSVSNAIAFRWP
jgi:uncharacterized protein (TIGR02594 family)